MFYTFTKEEYEKINMIHELEVKDLKDKNRRLVRRLSTFVNPETCGSGYCDNCNIKELCTYEYKNWSK